MTTLEELFIDIMEREEALRKLDKSHPLYPIMFEKLIERKEKYELMLLSKEKERFGRYKK